MWTLRAADKENSEEETLVRILLVEDSKPIRRANETALVKA